jgi:hypothetical protein
VGRRARGHRPCRPRRRPHRSPRCCPPTARVERRRVAPPCQASCRSSRNACACQPACDDHPGVALGLSRMAAERPDRRPRLRPVDPPVHGRHLYAAPGVRRGGPAAGRAPPGLGRAGARAQLLNFRRARALYPWDRRAPRGGAIARGSAEGSPCRPLPKRRASAAARGRRSRSRLGAPRWDPAPAEACARLFASFTIAVASPRPAPSSSNGAFAIARRRRRERAAAARAEGLDRKAVPSTELVYVGGESEPKAASDGWPAVRVMSEAGLGRLDGGE